MHRKILIIEAYTDANIGSGALFLNSVKILRAIDPKAEVRIMAHYPEAFAGLLGVDAVPDVFRFPYAQKRFRQAIWLAQTLLWMIASSVELLLPRFARVVSHAKLKDLEWADVVVSIGAERLNDNYPKNIAFSLYICWLAKKMKRSVIIFPCTIGPLYRRVTKFFVKRLLRSLDHLYVRDHRSFDTVNAMGVLLPGQLIETSDVAILQEPETFDPVQFRATIGVPSDRAIVGISAMRWTYVQNSKETSYSNYAAYVDQMAQVADALIEKHGVYIVFYPTNFAQRGCREDDVSVSNEIVAHMIHKGHAKVVDWLLSPAELMGMLSLSEVNITTRMHACILSTAVGVPTLSVNYMFKLRGYMARLEMEEFSIDIEEFNAPTMLNKFENLWNERAVWRKHLQTLLKEKRSELWLSMKAINDLV
jgi:polysaccharide pyruvyl transferase WcaK-like protein